MKYIKIFFIIITLFCCLSLIAYFAIPHFYPYGRWFKPAFDLEKFRYSICTYDIPSDYKIIHYAEEKEFHHIPHRGFILFHNLENKNNMIIAKLPEFKMVDLSAILEDPILNTQSYFKQKINIKGVFTIHYLIPPLRTDDFRGKAILTIEGIEEPNKKYLQTPETKMLYINGKFRQIGLVRKPKNFILRYAIPIIEFNERSEGAIAIVNNNVTGETIIAIGNAYQNGIFDKQNFLHVVESIRFDTKPPKALIKMLNEPPVVIKKK